MPDDVVQPPLENVEPIELQEEMERSFLEYSMSVITARALPDVRDGLKPVQRRILYGMYEDGTRPDRQHKKSSASVGYVMGNYHPHGDGAIYDALARMAQDFSLRYPLIDGHGNFGSPDPNDRPGAARYTEARLHQLAMDLLGEIDEDTVDWTANYDGTREQPVVLPARFPNLLVNGNTGIAVGMATNIPPHNLGEVIDAAVHLVDQPLPERDARVAVDGRVVGHDPPAHRHGDERRDDGADTAARELDFPVDARLIAGSVVVVEASGDVRAEHAVLDREVSERERREDVRIQGNAGF